ncbi:Ni/Fe-hydrogenase, b-type cytochrome subunit [Raineyella fluvialis]|uniref:Ni/Fe-hydrogenase, b-type cytochrome subunit n=2 Tax=Raineyella fluvialis TaxID=2662261 RepID=A0A5Q2FK97_9ACTN|nr:Ni/Fe-hydrogenase, b-type cytochrome subunit [Raineyella fluvialis]
MWVGSAFSLEHLSEARVLALAALAPRGSTDPVDRALGRALRSERPDIRLPEVEPADVDPARVDRRYSLTRARDFPLSAGSSADVMVMRGRMTDVLRQVSNGPEEKSVARRNAAVALRRGCRTLAVAVAPIGPDGVPGKYRLEGYVTVRPDAAALEGGTMAAHPGNWVRVNVWTGSLRLQHWINVAMVFILSCTGYFIMDPFFGPAAPNGTPTGFLMGWMRLIHFGAAFVWLVVGATRVVLAFISRDPYLRWSAFWPLKKKEDVRNLGRVVQHYALIKKEGPLYLAHNPLQQLTYTAVYVACAVQMATGLTLFGLYNQGNALWRVAALPVHWFGVPGVRLFHTAMMFLLWVFVIIHVYLAVRADSLERHGGLSSMINGGVWLRRGAKPVDAPEVE